MEFYITFKEFKENYEKDLTEWLNTYPDATEEDFLQFIKEEYIYILPLFMDVSINNKNIKFKRSFNVSKSYKNGYIEEENISGYQYADILRLNFMYYIREVKRCKDIKQKDVRLFLRYYWREVTGSVLSPYNLILEYHEIYKPFFKANEVINDPNIILFDEKKYINFEFSINRIFEFIDNRLEELKNPPQQTETETKQQKYSNPLKVKILDELNVQGWLLEKGFTVTQIQYLLSDLFDVTDKSIRNYFKDQKYTDKAKTIINEIKNSKSDR